ncbi:MAG TPA: toll/interleukin-1 receptor domain-containing protein, partial [Burkholderiaceae bacterium]|nr:toll/interleukin-1 receptor domain-containing protein [Burkholderiaceae bacterium]
MPAGIFISYRRQEALKEARAIFEKLSREFGAGQVFIDLEGLDYGVDFVESLERQLQHCQVMLVLIGPGWVAAPDGHGGRRLDDANDFVRIELRAALQRNIRVVPVLFDGAPMPRTSDLPADLEPLARRNK